MPYTEIEYGVRDRIATVTLNRPQKMNAFTFTMRDELLDVFDRIDADDDVRAVVVTGAGRAFCAGADLSAGGDTFDKDKAADLITGEGDRLEDGTPRDGGGMVALRIARCLKPVIGAFNGAAVGVGVTMTLPMDVRLASEKAKFGFVFARRGIVAEAASSWFLPRLVGIAQAMEWAASSTPGRRWRAASSPASCRRTSCCPPPTRWRARSPTTRPRCPSPRSAGSCGPACPRRPRGTPTPPTRA